MNDCSTDSTISILNRYTSQYPNIIVITNNKNLGCHPSVRQAFDNALGEWLVFLPSDPQIKAEIVSLAFPFLDIADLVVTDRVSRQDNTLRRLVSFFITMF